MFERRLKVLLGIAITLTAVLFLRAAYLQVLGADYWRSRAINSMKRVTLIETVRGAIRDCKGRALAIDEPCIDAAVEYGAIVRDETWMKSQAAARLGDRLGEQFTGAGKSQRKQMIEQELPRLSADLDAMWLTLARLGGKTPDEIEEIKTSIRARVDIRRRIIIHQMTESARRVYDDDNDSSYTKWLLGDSDRPDEDKYGFVRIPEQNDAHVVLAAIRPEIYNYLKKHEKELPGVRPQLSKHRRYPYNDVACHVIGQLGPVSRQERRRDPNVKDERRQLLPNDLVGKSGLEKICESVLRGVKGRIRTIAGRDEVLDSQDPTPGSDVRITIDIELQKRIENAFRHAQFWDKHATAIEQEHEAHGAAVVIDVGSGEVRALVSYPTYDLNQYDDKYRELVTDAINQPLLHRAIQMAIVPGSTVKPMIGIGAVSGGAWPIEQPVTCNGYLVIDGRPLRKFGRCWVATGDWIARLSPEMWNHRHIPERDPHPTGDLVLADAIQRSCNVYFETLGDKLGLEGLSYWFEQFGLGQKTGIGLPGEVTGHLPRSIRTLDPDERRRAAWSSSIGQYPVLATPVQMANVAATIARNGTWKRPRLLPADLVEQLVQPGGQEQRCLPVAPAALAAVQDGMIKVVNTKAGSAHDFIGQKIGGVLIAGKTGTAQTDAYQPPLLDSRGVHQRANGRLLYLPALVPHSKEHPNPQTSWHRGQGASGNNVSHAWFIGYAPADNPQIAFAVVVEYGGSGGHATYSMVKAIIEGCMELQYLKRVPR